MCLLKKLFCTSHRQRVNNRSQPSIDRGRTRHPSIICHMRKTCEFEVSVFRCWMLSATRKFVESPLCSKVPFLNLLQNGGEFLNLSVGIIQCSGKPRVDSPCIYASMGLFIIAPSIVSPFTTYLQSATINCRARATMAVLRMRPFCSRRSSHYAVRF